MPAADIVRGVSSGASGGTVTGISFAVTAPTGAGAPQAGDKIVVEITLRDAMTGWRVPAGFNPVAITADETTGEGFFYTATYGDGTGGTVTGTSWTFDNGAGNVTASKWVWSMVVLRGDKAGALVAAAAQGRASSGTNTPTPSLSPAVPVHLVAMAGDRITGGSTWTWPAGWTEQTDLLNEAGGSNVVSSTSAVYDTTPTAAGTYSVTPVNSTTGAVGWAAIFAFEEAPAGPTGGNLAVTGSGSLALIGPDAPLPGSLPASVEPETHGHWPTFVDGNGNLYRITEEPLAAGNNPQMLKSSVGGGGTWAVVDAAGQPTGSSFNDMEGGWTIQVGTSILLVFTDDTSIFYCTFNTSDAATNPDTWQVKEVAFALSATSGSRAAASIARLSDGRVRAVYQNGPSGSNLQLGLATKSTTTGAAGWSGNTALTASTESCGSPHAVVGAGDMLHILYHNITDHTVLYRTLTSAGVLSAATRVDTAGTNTNGRNYHAVSNPIYYDAAGVEVIAVLYAAASGLRLIQITGGVATDELVDSVTPLIGPNNNAGADTGADGPIVHLAVDGTTLHAVMSDGTTGDAVHRSRPHGGSWSARTTLRASGAGEVQWLYNNVYTRNSKRVMGYTCDVGPHGDDEAFIEYNELALADPPLTGALTVSGSGALTLSGKPTAVGALTVTGSGALALSATSLTAGGALTVTGSGALTLSGKPGAAGTLAATGSGALALSGQAIIALSGTLAATGSGALTLSGKPGAAGTLVTTGSGVLTLSPAGVALAGLLAVAGSGALTLSGKPGAAGTLAITGSGALALSGGNSGTGALSLSGSGALLLTVLGVLARGSLVQAGAGQLQLASAGQSVGIESYNGTAWIIRQPELGPAVYATVSVLTAGGWVDR